MRVLISAYACEPRTGSEPAVGWLWSLAAAANHDVTVITRTSRRTAVAPGDIPEGLELAFVDLPSPVLRLVRSHDRLYYVLWQLAAGVTARRLHRRSAFDVVHHLTYANAWLPALVHWASAPFVLGPVGGGSTVAPSLRSELDRRSRLFELVRTAARVLNTFNPLVRSGWRRAGVIIVQNEETTSRLPRRYRSKTVLRCNSVVGPDLDEVVRVQPRDAPTSAPRALLAGRLRDWKGGTLAIRALPRTRLAWSLDIVGEGRSESKLRALVRELGVEDRVTFTPWLSRQDLWRRMQDASALVLPSLRDDAPLVVAEAQALGVPVVALDQGGPAVMATEPTASIRLVPVADPETTVHGLASALDRIVSEPPVRRPNAAFGLPALEAFVDATYERAAK